MSTVASLIQSTEPAHPGMMIGTDGAAAHPLDRPSAAPALPREPDRRGATTSRAAGPPGYSVAKIISVGRPRGSAELLPDT
jgi:hypothetical protein